MNRSRKLFLAALGFLVLALVSFLFSKKTIGGLIRQRADEQAAEAYVQAAVLGEMEEKRLKVEELVSEDSEEEEASETVKIAETSSHETEEDAEKITSREDPETEPGREKSPVQTDTETDTEPSQTDAAEPSYIPVTDDAYFERGGVVYTPEYAVGRIDCVLEIPCISLRRCVYTGTDEEIMADLDMWFTVSASGALVPGETHYAIFGHNHTVQNLSFNRLAEVSVGDYFTLTRDSEVYIYLVTDMFAAERGAGRAAYAYNDALDPSLCYIFTCGRDYMLLNGVSTRYKDLIVEGTLWRVVPASVWMGEEENSPAPEEPVETEAREEAEPSGVPEEIIEASEKDSPTLHEALAKEQEKVRASHPSPVLTLNAQEDSITASAASGTPSFSWSLLLVYLTAGFAALSVLLFLLSLVMHLITARNNKRASRKASA